MRKVLQRYDESRRRTLLDSVSILSRQSVFGLLLVFLTAFSGSVWGANVNVSFASWNTGVSAYSDTEWTDNGCTFTYSNNNNKGWAYVRCGGKGSDKTSTIRYNSKVTISVDSIILNTSNGIGNGSSSSITITGVQVDAYSNSSFTTLVSSKNLGTLSYTSSNCPKSIKIAPTTAWEKDLYYKITISWSQTGSKNCGLNISEITFYEAASTDPAVTVDPESVAFGTVKQYTTTDESYWVLEDVHVTGENLTDDVVLTSNYSAVFNILDPTKGSGVAASYTIKQHEGAIDTTITVVAYTNADVTLDKTITVSSAKETPEFEAFNIPVSITITPTFYVGVTVNDGEMGTATVNGVASVYADEETDLVLLAEAKPGYEFVNWTFSDAENIVKNDGDENKASVTILAAAAQTITANFQAQSCTGLDAPTLNKLTKSYNYANLKWTEVANAANYRVNVVKHEGSVPHITNLLTPDLETDILNLDANTQYDYTVMAVGDGTDYCDASNPLLEGSFTTNDYPAATLTLSENGETRTWGSDLKVASVIALPTAVAAGQEVAGKVLVGYTNEANKTYSHDTDAPATLYAPGANYTIADTEDKLYAVYAIEIPGAKTTKTDELDRAFTGLTVSGSASYTNWSGKTGTSGAVYAGNSAAGDTNNGECIQLRTSSNTGVISTTTGAGKISKVTVTWRSGNTNGRYLDVYGKNSAYEAVSELFDEQKTGTLLGSLQTNGASTVLNISGNYDFIGLRSRDGAIYLSEIDIEWTATAASTFTKYATTGAKAPQATVEPTSVALGAAALVGGLIDVTYSNVNAANVAVALFDDEACETAFSGEWLNVSLDANKDIEYGAQAAVSYANTRTAYIKLTAPSTAEGVDPAVVVIPVTQAKKEAVFASLAELVASDVPSGDSVTITLTNVEIKSFYLYNSNRAGVAFDVQKAGNDVRIYKNVQTTINDWAVGGTLSGTFRAKWEPYNTNEWQLKPNYNWAWANLTYKAPSGLAWSAATGKAYTVGKAASLPSLTNTHSLAVTYSSTDATVATVSNEEGHKGEITPLKAGTTTIKATFAGDDTYAAKEVSYELTVLAPIGLSLSGTQTKKQFEFGDHFNPATDGEYLVEVVYVASPRDAYDVTSEATWDIDGKTLAEKEFQATGSCALTAHWNTLSDWEYIEVTKIFTHIITFEQPEHGTLTVKWLDSPIESPYETVKTREFTVVATPDANYELATLTAGGVDIKSTKAFTMGTEDIEVVATFSKLVPSISVKDVYAQDIASIDFGNVDKGASVNQFNISLVGHNLTGDVKVTVANSTSTTVFVTNGFRPSNTYSPTAGEIDAAVLVIPYTSTGGEFSGTITFHSESGDFSDIVIPLSINIKPDASLAWSASTGTAYTKVKPYTLPTLTNPHSVTVAYSGNNNDVATVDASTGAVTLVAAGDVTITASFAGNDDYVAQEVEYTLTVKAPTGIRLDGEMTTKEYEAGDHVSVAGYTVEAVFGSPYDYYDVTSEATWTLDGVDIATKTITATAQYTIEATWQGFTAWEYVNLTRKTHAVTFNSPEHGNLTVKVGGSTFLSGAKWSKGTVLTITISPDEGYEGAVTVNGNALVGTSFTIGTEDVAIVATFTKAKVASGLAWSAASADVRCGASNNEFPTLTKPEDLTASIVYSSTNEAIATINASTGAISLKANGSTTIKAAFENDPNYLDAEVSYTLNVSAGIVTVTGAPIAIDFGEVLKGDVSDNYTGHTFHLHIENLSANKQVVMHSVYGLCFSDPYYITADANGIIDRDVTVLPYRSGAANMQYNDQLEIWCTGAREFADVPIGTATYYLAEAYAITVDEITGGSLTWNGGAAPTVAKPGTEFALVATPAEGYKGGTITVAKKSDNTDVTAEVLSSGTLTMPSYAINVSVSFTPSTPTAIDNAEAEVKVVKFIENGQIFIQRGSKVYTIDGQLVK